ncbi:MAG: cytochrome c [Caulobacteraceae bacterium]
MKTLLASLALAAVAASPALAQPDGRQLFADNCSACHQPTGKGIAGAFPALDGDRFVTGDPGAVAHTVLYGRGGMPSFKDQLSDEQIAAILTYVRSAWSNKAGPETPQAVDAARAGPAASAHAQLQAH